MQDGMWETVRVCVAECAQSVCTRAGGIRSNRKQYNCRKSFQEVVAVYFPINHSPQLPS